MRFSCFYFVLFIGFFITEVLIAVYIKDDFIRPYLGDTFVVILIYSFIRSFFSSPIYPTIISVLFFSYAIEIMQFFNLVELLGLGDYKLARIIIGTSSAWGDIVAYTAGAVLIGIFEHYHIGSNK